MVKCNVYFKQVIYEDTLKIRPTVWAENWLKVQGKNTMLFN